MSDLPIGVLGVYAALVVWAATLAIGLRQRRYGPFFGVGIGLMLFLNLGYFVRGAPHAIAFFVGIYDVLGNLGVSESNRPAALATCPDNGCSVWGDRFESHPSWGVAFHDRFLNGPQFRRNLLYGHIAFNTITFVLMHVQLLRPGGGAGSSGASWHRKLGRFSFASLTLGTICAVWMASEHGSVGEYGGVLSTLGFYSMSAVVYGCAVMGVVAIRRGNDAAHRVWMIRFAGSMWGAFWLFRVMLFITDPLLRNFESAALLWSIWASAPLGVAIAEYFRRRSLRETRKIPPTIAAPIAAGAGS